MNTYRVPTVSKKFEYFIPLNPRSCLPRELTGRTAMLPVRKLRQIKKDVKRLWVWVVELVFTP